MSEPFYKKPDFWQDVAANIVAGIIISIVLHNLKKRTKLVPG